MNSIKNQKSENKDQKVTNDQEQEEKNIQSELPEESNEVEKETVSKQEYLRALADYQNLARRIDRERKEIFENASETIIHKLLPTLDDLERAKQTIHDKGIELIHKKFWDVLEKEGLEQIKIHEKDEFDPNKMECIDAELEGKRLIEVRSGYIIKGKVIRPVQVKVVK